MLLYDGSSLFDTLGCFKMGTGREEWRGRGNKTKPRQIDRLTIGRHSTARLWLLLTAFRLSHSSGERDHLWVEVRCLYVMTETSPPLLDSW